MKYLLLISLSLALTGCAGTIARAIADYRAEVSCTTDSECEAMFGEPVQLVVYHE